LSQARGLYRPPSTYGVEYVLTNRDLIWLEIVTLAPVQM
jgi:hypothetical protein